MPRMEWASLYRLLAAVLAAASFLQAIGGDPLVAAVLWVAIATLMLASEANDGRVGARHRW